LYCALVPENRSWVISKVKIIFCKTDEKLSFAVLKAKINFLDPDPKSDHPPNLIDLFCPKACLPENFNEKSFATF